MIDWEDEPPPIEQLQAESELLRLVAFWREKYEELRESIQQSLRQA